MIDHTRMPGGGTGEITCDEDGCGNAETFDGDFMEVVQEAKAAGWRITKKDGEWHHICPDCQEG